MQATALIGDYFVSPSGSDASPGTKALPWATVAHAQAVLRTLLPSAGRNLTVLLRGGTYFLPSALALTSADSGQGGNRAVWCAYPGETPVISGGVALTGTWVNTSGHIWRLPVANAAAYQPRALWYNGTRCKRAQAMATALSIPGGITVSSSSPLGYTSTAGWLDAYGNPSDIEFIYRDSLTAAFYESRIQVAAIGATTITMTAGFAFQIDMNTAMGRSDVPSLVENAYEIFSANAAVGTFYLDRTNNFLYLITPDGSNPNGQTVILPVLEQLLTITGASDISLYGLTLRHANWLLPFSAGGYPGYTLSTYITTAELPVSNDTVFAQMPTGALQVNGSNRVQFTRCTFEQMGAATTVWIYAASQDTALRGCVLRDLSGTGILNSGASVAEQTNAVKRTVVDNCVIHSVGLEFVAAYGVLAMWPDSIQLTHNVIHHTPLGAIHCGYGWNEVVAYPNGQRLATISGNVIHDTFTTGDGSGAIHVIGHHPGSVIQGNVVYNVGGAASQAYFLDDGTQNLTMTDNVAYSIGTSGNNTQATNNSAGGNTISGTTADSGRHSYSNFSGSDTIAAINVVSTAAATAAGAALGAGLQSGYLDLASA